MIYRIVMDPRHPAGVAEIHGQWDVGDLIHAHVYLDAMDEIREIVEAREKG